MNRKIVFPAALALAGALVSLTSSDSTVGAQQPQRFVADTGIMPPGPRQQLRLKASAGLGKEAITVRLRRMEYVPGPCDAAGVCRLAVAAQGVSNPITLAPGEAASFELTAGTYGRGTVFSNSRDLRVTVEIIDSATGQVVSLVPIVGTMLIP